MKLDAKTLRKIKPNQENIEKIKRNPIYFVLDNIIDTYNVGSMFRLADAIACEKIYLCEKTEYPPNSRIHKAAVGTQNWVPWEKKDSTLQTIKELKKTYVQIIAIEQDKNSLIYKDILEKVRFPCALVVGNETEGIQKKILKEADLIVELPMFGINKSFNVWGSAAVVAYKILEKII